MTPYLWIAVALLIASGAMIVHAHYAMDGKELGGVMLLLTSTALLATGCVAIDERAGAPPDWPRLRVVVHKSGFMGRQQCNGTLGGCAVPDFCARRCDIYLQIDSSGIEAHERAHCAGYDHVDEDTMRTLWAAYKQMDGPRQCSFRMGIANYCALWPEDNEQCAVTVTTR